MKHYTDVLVEEYLTEWRPMGKSKPEEIEEAEETVYVICQYESTNKHYYLEYVGKDLTTPDEEGRSMTRKYGELLCEATETWADKSYSFLLLKVQCTQSLADDMQNLVFAGTPEITNTHRSDLYALLESAASNPVYDLTAQDVWFYTCTRYADDFEIDVSEAEAALDADEYLRHEWIVDTVQDML